MHKALWDIHFSRIHFVRSTRFFSHYRTQMRHVNGHDSIFMCAEWICTDWEWLICCAACASRAAVAVQMTSRDLTVCVSVVGSEMWMLVLACTLPLPAGYFMPVFVYGEWRERAWVSLFCNYIHLHNTFTIWMYCKHQEFVLRPLTRMWKLEYWNLNFCSPGAALGRLLGEGVAYVSSTGVTSGQQWAYINPGGYALAGIKNLINGSLVLM